MSDALKKQAAIAAVEEIKDGMIVGLGTGSTATHFIRELGARVAKGLRVKGIPTSEESRRLAAEVGVPLTTFGESPVIDITVDGADEVSPALDLIKGLGGALVREKVVAHASRRVVIVADDSKVVDRLGSRAPIPVEVVPFAADPVAARLARWGGQAAPRQKKDGGGAFVSDNGNLVLDWAHGVIDDPAALEREIRCVAGVVDCGIFSGVAHRVIIAGAGGIRFLDRSSRLL